MAEKERAGQERTEGKYWEPDGALENETNPKRRMGQMKNILEHSEKGGLFKKKNSELFDKIITELKEICDKLSLNFPVPKDTALKELKALEIEYDKLLVQCEEYLAHTRLTRKGKNRKRMVAYIRDFAQKDKQGIRVLVHEELFSSPIERYASVPTMAEVLQNARIRVIEMGEGEHGTVGGEANRLTVLDEKKDGIDGFFSERKIIHRNDAGTLGGGDKVSYENAFQEHLTNISSDTFDSNARNVATSRIAELFGVGRLIAKSEMVELREKGQKTGKMGSVMEKAKGEMARNVIARVIGDALYKKGKDKWTSNNFDFRAEGSKMMEGLVTGNFQRDMSDLQVLDYLCGQIDRHHDNYFISLSDEGKFDTVQGIDNDLSFGDAQHKGNLIGPHGRRVVSEEGDLFIPHMSRKFAEAIDTVKEEMVRFILADLIEAPEIEAFCRRLAVLKKAVAKELQKKSGESKLLSDNEWNDSTLQDFLTAGKSYDSMNEGTANYVGTSIRDHANTSMQVTNQMFKHYKAGGK